MSDRQKMSKRVLEDLKYIASQPARDGSQIVWMYPKDAKLLLKSLK